MDRYGPSTYGDRIASRYDETIPPWLPLDAVVDVLAGLAGDGPALELGVGTGRIALPLRARGVDVHGIDASEAMVDQLRAKPGGADIPVTIGDFADVPVEGEYTVVYVPWNTFFALTSQAAQRRCFVNVARHLVPGGAFVIDVYVPRQGRWQGTGHLSPIRVELGEVEIEVSQHDAAAQTVTMQQLVIRPDGVTMVPAHMRYAWPSELDLMARLAGLRLRDRWAGWDRAPFGPDSGGHVSVYERPP
jgi:SAM-dependent methyltransferase